ncbi:MAG: hypothetical protein FWF10_07235 [Clostridiales bacterium]|nr:hypothetical protein [Clostridiales bacterium]
MKKIMVILLAILLALPGLVVLAAEIPDPNATPNPNADLQFWLQRDVSGKVGDIVTVDILLVTKYELSYWGMEIHYNPAQLRLAAFDDTVVKGGLLENALIATNMNDPGVVRSYGAYKENGPAKNGVMYTAYFEILSAEGGWLLISNASYGILKDNKRDTVAGTLPPVGGVITVPAQPGQSAAPLPTPDPVIVSATILPAGTQATARPSGSSAPKSTRDPSATIAPNNLRGTDDPNSPKDKNDPDNPDDNPGDEWPDDGFVTRTDPGDTERNTEDNNNGEIDNPPKPKNTMWVAILLGVGVLFIGGAVTAGVLGKRARKQDGLEEES